MNLIHKFLLSSAMLAMGVAAHAQSVLSVSDNSMTPSLSMPESVETNTKEMLENWYLKNYTVLDYDADSKDSGDLSDQVIIDRLAALPTVIEMPFNSVVKNSILFYANRKKQLVENMLGLSLYYMPIFVDALERHGLPLELKYLPVIESALVPTAVSRAGAGGLWQFMPATAAGLGLEINSLVDQRRDPYLSSEAAARYLKQLFNTYNDWSLAIAAYN
ncbi:MAG: lytic transglycosylase domain-containing protein, partial [Muribaculaceae bacterium]|nr:lytic transglycosylase domain-containing protein [Muribaculaceae bacterium]